MRSLLLAACLLPLTALAATPEVTLTIKDHRFSPVEVHVPAGKRIKLIVENRDRTPEEFESYDLNREKIIPGGSKGVIYIGPLDAGRHPFFGDFHKDTAKGAVIAE